jgi:hypothetical protein
MVEVHTGQPEADQQKSSVNAAEPAWENRQAHQEPQSHRPEMPHRSQEQRNEEARAQTGEQRTDGQAQQEAPWEEDVFINEMFGGETEEQINAHNERIKADREKEQQEKEKVREEVLKQYEKHHARLAAMTPEEREAYEKREEKIRTPLKPMTPEEWSELVFTMHRNVQAMQRKKAAWLHERDPRYDPMTGDLLEPDELPLSPTSEYYFDGQTRPRRFVPPDSPHLDKYKEFQIDEEDVQPEGVSHERLVERLLKAGFVEVEPTLADKASFEQTQWYRSLSPSEKLQFVRESMQEMTHSGSFDKETTGEKVGETIAQLIELMIDFLLALMKPDMIEEADRDKRAQKPA